MTGTAESNAISRYNISFHIINVMDTFSAFATDCADVIIALADHAFECTVERWRIWLERRAAIPAGMIFKYHKKFGAFIRAESSTMSFNFVTKCNKFLATIFANDAYPSVFIRAFPRTKTRSVFLVSLYGIILFAMFANLYNWPSLPVRMLFANHGRSSAFIRTIFTNPVRWIIPKNFPTMFAFMCYFTTAPLGTIFSARRKIDGSLNFTAFCLSTNGFLRTLRRKGD